MKYPGYWIMGGLGGKHCRETKAEQWARSTFLVGNLDDVGGRLGSDPGDPSTGSAAPISIGVRTFLHQENRALLYVLFMLDRAKSRISIPPKSSPHNR